MLRKCMKVVLRKGGVRQRPPLKWISRMDEYWRETEKGVRLGIEGARRECLNKEN